MSSFQRACATLSPARLSTTPTENETDPSGFVVLYIEQTQPMFHFTKGDKSDADSPSTAFSYTGKQCLTPEGCNSFEVVFVITDDGTPVSPAALFPSMEIGCLM